MPINQLPPTPNVGPEVPNSLWKWLIEMGNRIRALIDWANRYVASSGVEAHASTHASGGSDELTPAAIGAAADDHTHTAQIPAGGIIMWSGSIASIPASWYLCNGENGTPDLRNRFIVGAGQDGGSYTPGNDGAGTGYYAPGATGGQDKHTLTIAEMPSHNHTNMAINMAGATYNGAVAGGAQSGSWTTNTASNYSGGGQSHENRPLYYALCFIMKG